MRKETPRGYEAKFAGLIRAIDQAKQEGAPHILVATPHALGDTYDEVIESLWRLAKTQLGLFIAQESRVSGEGKSLR